MTVLVLFCIFQAQGQQKKQPPQYRQEPAPVTVHEISRHVYEVRGGSGANCAFIIGENEVIVIDAKMTEQSAADMLKAIRSKTDKPVKKLLLTHSDGDHVNGIPGFPANIEIIAHENCAGHIRKANEPGPVKIRLPDITFYNQLNLYSGDLKLNLLYFGPAHTDGNIVIYVPVDRVAVIGDLFFKGMDPLVHRNKNGSSEGFVNVLQKIADLDADIFLSGHAEPVKKEEIGGLRDTIIEKREKVMQMVSEGKGLDDVKKAFGVPEGQSFWPSLAEIIYAEMTEK